MGLSVFGAMQMAQRDIYSSSHETMPLLTFNFCVSNFKCVMDKHFDMPLDANGRVKINGSYSTERRISSQPSSRPRQVENVTQ